MAIVIAPPTDVRMGWLTTFLCVADCLSYERAGERLGKSATSVSRVVGSLEVWLARVLIMDDGVPHELSRDGAIFQPIAQKALSLLKSLETERDVGPQPDAEMCHTISSLWLSDFLAVKRVWEGKGFKDAAARLGLDEKTVRDKVRRTERSIGTTLFGRNGSRAVNYRSLATIDVLAIVIASLTGFRMVLPPDFNLSVVQSRHHYDTVRKHVVGLRHNVRMLEISPSTPARSEALQKVTEHLTWCEVALDLIEQEYGPFERIDARTIMID